ncbi:MAG TPA: hypothetical protein VN805_05230 [Caulobacteraceae bacterium]|nr:hypothetical protein [Caulobacteraceae bacterium]
MTPLATNAIEFAAPTLPSAEVESGFADPDWRGEQRDPDRERAPLASLVAQAGRLEDWIRGGACYGWLDSYQSRRAGFELQSIRAQLKGCAAGAGRWAIQSRLDRLDQMLRRARGAAWAGEAR